MHPGPMNRGIEIASEVADGPQSVIREQVTNGVAVRMAVLDTDRAQRAGAQRRGRPDGPYERHASTAARSSSRTRSCCRSRNSPAQQFVIRLRAPKCAATRDARQLRAPHAATRSFPMRRPLSIMRADPAAGWIEILYKIVRARPRARCRGAASATTLSVLGPIGTGFAPSPARPRDAARRRRRRHPADGVPRRIPARPRRRRLAAAGADGLGDPVPVPRAALDDPRARHAGRRDRLHAAARRLGRAEPARELAGFPGCYDGYVTDLAAAWLVVASTRRRSPRSRCSPAARRRC